MASLLWFYHPSLVPPQGLCTCFSFCLQCPSSDPRHSQFFLIIQGSVWMLPPQTCLRPLPHLKEPRTPQSNPSHSQKHSDVIFSMFTSLLTASPPEGRDLGPSYFRMDPQGLEQHLG